MDPMLQASAAVMKLWNSMKSDENLRQLALGAPEKAVASLGVALPEGVELDYVVQGGQHRMRISGNQVETRVFVFEGGGCRIEGSEAPPQDDALGEADLEMVAGGVGGCQYGDSLAMMCWAEADAPCANGEQVCSCQDSRFRYRWPCNVYGCSDVTFYC